MAIYDKWTDNIICSGKKLKALLRTGKRQGYSSLQFLFNIVLHRAMRQEKVVKDVQIGNEEVKLSLFARGMILRIGN